MDEKERGEEIDCPNPAMWLKVSAGTADSDLSALLSAHAATCDQCGPRLREAAHLFAETDDSDEEFFLASLKSASPAWQKQMAQRLASPVNVSPAQGFLQSLSSWLAPNWRLAFALPVGAFVVGFSWLVIAKQHSPMTATLPLQSTWVAQPSPAKSDQSAKSDKASSSPQPAEQLLASITLEPGRMRGRGHTPSVKLHPETATLVVKLLFMDAPPTKLHLDLLDSRQHRIWSKDLEVSGSEIDKLAVTVRIPAKGLSPDEYQIVAGEQTETGIDNVANYAYRVTR